MMVLSSVGQHFPAEDIAAARISYWLTKPVRQSELFNFMVELTRDTSSLEEAKPAQAGTQAPLALNAQILLVEDNPVNQEVALAMLETLGCGVTLAANGQEALDAFSAGSYDVVLMDCQLPVMDGFEATAAIRQRELGTGRHQAIVALTANAMQGDQERCLAAGMDDYLAKPFEREQLRAILQKWLPKRSAIPAAASPALAHNAGQDGAAVLDQAVLNNILSLQKSGGQNILKKLVDLYLESTPKLMSALETGIHQHNPAAVRNAAHTLKSSSANLGASKLSALCKEVESSVVGGEDVGRLNAKFERIETEYQQARSALLRECEKL